MTDYQQQKLNTLIGKVNGGIEVKSPVATTPIVQDIDDNYEKAMKDLELKNKLDDLYKAPSDYNPDDLTFKDKASALFRSSNMTYAYALRQEDMTKDIGDEILSKYNDRQFNAEEVTKEIANSTLNGFSKFIEDNPATSWEDLERKKGYYENHLKDLNIVANEIPLALSIPSSIVAGIFDADTVALGLATGGVGLFGKGATLLARAKHMYDTASYGKKVAMGAGLGTAYSGLNEAMYQEATGVYSKEHFATALAMGGLLGGGLTGLLNINKVVRTQTNNNTYLREDIENSRTAIIDKETALKDAQEHYKNYNEVLNLAISVKENTNVIDKIRSETINKLHKAEIEEVFTTKPKVDDVKKEFIEQNKAVITKAKEEVKTVMDNANTKFKELEKARKEIPVLEAKILKKVEDLESKILAKQESITTNKTIGKKVEGLTKQLNSLKTQLKDTKTELNKVNTRKNSLVKQEKITKPEDLLTKKELNKLNKGNETITKFNTELENTIKTRKETYESKLKELRSMTKEQLIDKYKDDQRIVGLTSKYSGKTKEEIVQDLLQKTDNYKQWSAKLEDGTFTVNDYITADATRKSYVDRLKEDLADMQNKLSNAEETAKVLENEIKINPLLKNMLWTPIAKLQTSKNPYVRALATKMSTGTIHTNTYNGKTALRQKQNLDEDMKNISTSIINDYKEAVKSGAFKGSIDDYHKELGMLRARANDELDARAFSQTDPSLPYAKRREDSREIKSNLQYDYSRITDNSFFIKSMDKLNKFYESRYDMGITYKIDGFEGASRKGYMNRQVDLNKLATMSPEQAKLDVLNAQIKYLNDRGVTVDVNSETFKTLQIKADNFIESALDKKTNINRVIDQISEGKLGNREVTHSRTIDVNASDLEHILNTDSNYLMTNYGRQVHGNFALQDVFGMYKRASFEQLMKDNNFSAKDRDLFVVALEDIKGIREMIKDPYSVGQLALGLTSRLVNISYVGNFGMASTGEIFVAMDRYGAFNTLKNIIPSARSTYQLWKNASIDDRNLLLAMTNKTTPRASSNMLSTENSMMLEQTNRIFKGLDYIADKLAKIGLLQPITDFVRILSASSAQSWLASVAHKNSLGKRLSQADTVRLAKFGLTEAELPNVKRELGLDERGMITNEHLDHSTFGNRILDGIQDSVDATVMSGSAMHLPTFMTDRGVNNWLSTLVFKFMRYPMEAYEKLLLRGIQELDARKIVMVGLNSMAFALMFTIKDAMKPEDSKKRYEGEDGFALLMRDSIAMNSYLGIVPSAVDFGWSNITGNNLTNDYKSSSISDSMIGKWQQGKFGFNLLNGRIEYDAVENQLQVFKYVQDLDLFSNPDK